MDEKEQYIQEISEILNENGCGSYSPENASKCVKKISDEYIALPSARDPAYTPDVQAKRTQLGTHMNRLMTLLAWLDELALAERGGRRKTRRGGKKRRGGYTDQVVEAKEALDELFNRWGCKTKDECRAKIDTKMAAAETEEEMAPLRTDSRTLNVLSAFIEGRGGRRRRA